MPVPGMCACMRVCLQQSSPPYAKGASSQRRFAQVALKMACGMRHTSQNFSFLALLFHFLMQFDLKNDSCQVALLPCQQSNLISQNWFFYEYEVYSIRSGISYQCLVDKNLQVKLKLCAGTLFSNEIKAKLFISICTSLQKLLRFGGSCS